MIYLYAVDPELSSDAKALRYVLSHMGVEHARLMVHYPKKWFKAALESAQKSGILNYKRVEELLKKAKGRKIVRVSLTQEYDPDIGWLNNVLGLEGCLAPIAVIVADGTPHSAHSKVLQESELDSNESWNVESSVSLERNSIGFGEASRILLMCGRNVKIVDPFFRPDEKEWRDVLEAIIEPLCTRTRDIVVEVHSLNAAKTLEQSLFRRLCEDRLPRHIPVGKKVKFVRWSQRADEETFHDRHILTDIGGLSIGHGFASKPGTTTSVHAFGASHAERLSNQLDRQNGPYDFVGEFIIEGVKR